MGLPALLERAKTATTHLSEVRANARASAIDVIRKIEDALVEVLGDERLKGLPNIGWDDANTAFRAFRVRGTAETPLEEGRDALVVKDDGRLAMAVLTISPSPRVTTRDVGGAELRIEDVEELTVKLEAVLLAHIKIVETRTAKLARCEELARRLHAALEA